MLVENSQLALGTSGARCVAVEDCEDVTQAMRNAWFRAFEIPPLVCPTPDARIAPCIFGPDTEVASVDPSSR